jgi:peroxiredoxin Q/BCP
MNPWIESGQKAPDFTLPADDGTSVKLSALRGSPVVLYFYPRDDTPGCTREACAFRDQRAELAKRGAKLLGVSTDPLESHRQFRDKYHLNFLLLSDTEHAVAERYGAWRDKGGKMGVQRSTFLIGPDGIVRQVWQTVQVDGHDAQVLAALDELRAPHA